MKETRLQKSMMSCLQSRYEDLRIYTYIGNVLIAVNPFQSINIYDDEVWLKSIKINIKVHFSFELCSFSFVCIIT